MNANSCIGRATCSVLHKSGDDGARQSVAARWVKRIAFPTQASKIGLNPMAAGAFATKVVQEYERLLSLRTSLGFRAAIAYRCQEGLGRFTRRPYALRPKISKFPIAIRRGTSDIDVFNQVFVRGEYDCLDDVANVQLIIDCGANVGYSTIYLLNKHERAHAIAVEPDAGNFAALRRNLAPYETRSTAIRAGIWPDDADLVMSESSYRGGREWSKQVRVRRPGEAADIRGVNISTLLAASGFDRVSILKMDVEGAEAVIYSRNYRAWLEKTDVIAIELHDDSVFGNGTEAFHSAIVGQGFDIENRGELTICRRR